MRAISLWQPFATAVAIGAKRIETRHWSTSYRGPLAIHAAKRLVKNELLFLGSCWNWVGALAPIGARMGGSKPLWELMPFGAIVATCELIDCRPTGSFTLTELDTPRDHRELAKDVLYTWTERDMGNFDLGRFGWVLDNVKPLATPIPYVGGQGFFNVPDAALREAA